MEGRPDSVVAVEEVTKRIAPHMILGQGARGPNPQDKSVRTFGAQCVEVEVDIETGVVKVVALHVNTHTGKSINRTNIELQLEGSAIFALGAALMEEMVYDDGHLVNPNLAEYMIPSFLDVPTKLTTRMVESGEEDAEPHGVGENATGPIPAAVAAAVYRAVGVRINEWPITPEKVLRALDGGHAV
jgi:CO/xanthine dehydrogenase Mo-binding subunit